MTKDKILKIISGLCVGIGVGACFGVAMEYLDDRSDAEQ